METIKANELRIGNFLFKDGVVVTIDARSIFDIDKELKNYSPIPVTEEWLIKFGFIHHTNSYICICSRRNDFEDSFKLEFKYYYRQFEGNFLSYSLWSDNLNGYAFRKKILYVHQLQNLYFALTGEELTIKN